MNHKESALGNHVFKVIFTVTAPWALGWLLGVVVPGTFLERMRDMLGISNDAVFLGLIALLYGIAFTLLWPGLKVGRTWLSLQTRVSLRKALLSTALWSLVGYAIALPVCFLLALLMTRGNIYGEAGVFTVLFSLWMPLWWAVPIGVWMAWRRERQSQNRAWAKQAPGI